MCDDSVIELPKVRCCCCLDYRYCNDSCLDINRFGSLGVKRVSGRVSSARVVNVNQAQADLRMICM